MWSENIFDNTCYCFDAPASSVQALCNAMWGQPDYRNGETVMNCKRASIRFLIFAFGGMLGEVMYGAVRAGWSGNWNLHGQSSPWMMIDYGLLGVILLPLAVRLKGMGLPLAARAFVYMLLIYAVEYVSGIIFTRGMGLCVWSYEGIRYNLHGQIMLYSAPVWYLLGFAAEYLYGKIDAVAVLWLRGITAEQLLDMPLPAQGEMESGT